MQIRQRETLSHQRAIIHEVCLSSAQYLNHIIDGSACTAELKETEKGTTSHLLEVIEVLNENVKNLKSEMKQLAAENQATGKLLRALADQNSIYLDDLDSFD